MNSRQGETPMVRYYSGPRATDALRELLDDLEADAALVLIGLWNMSDSDGGVIQVVLTQ